jgi:hypothetical protein
VRRIDYNRLGPAGFRELCHAVLLRVLGPTYRPFSAGGPDAQRDGTFDGEPATPFLPKGYWVAQFKHHDVETVGASVCRRRFLREVKSELRRWQGRKEPQERIPDVFLFVTNVLATGGAGSGTFDRFDELARQFGKLKRGAQALLWDKARLDQAIDGLPDVQRIWLPPTIEDILAVLGAPAGSMALLVTTQEEGGVEFVASATYSSDWDAIVVVAEIGNETGHKLTIKEARLSLDGIGIFFTPDEPDPGKEVTGVPWCGPGVYGPIPPDEFRRVAWYFRVQATGVREALERGQPLRGTFIAHCFPRRTLAREVLVYSIAKLREMAQAKQPPPA